MQNVPESLLHSCTRLDETVPPPIQMSWMSRGSEDPPPLPPAEKLHFAWQVARLSIEH